MSPDRHIRDHAASVHQRLLNLAKERGTDFNLLLQRYTGERFLYRLGLSAHVDTFTLKGASLFLLWAGTEFRPTKDLDLLGTCEPDHENIRSRIEAICGEPCLDDGLLFDISRIRIEAIRSEREPGGIRVRLRAALGQARIPLQIDIGFGDVITPAREEAEYPTLLELPRPRVWAYPKETFVAEKLEALVRHGPRNTRMKDFWDLAAIAARFHFEGEILREAVFETFRQCGSTLDDMPEALRPSFYEDVDRIRSWEAFLQMAGETTDVPARFDRIGEIVRLFLGPLRESLISGETFSRAWPPGGPWATSRGSGEFDE